MADVLDMDMDGGSNAGRTKWVLRLGVVVAVTVAYFMWKQQGGGGGGGDGPSPPGPDQAHHFRCDGDGACVRDDEFGPYMSLADCKASGCGGGGGQTRYTCASGADGGCQPDERSGEFASLEDCQMSGCGQVLPTVDPVCAYRYPDLKLHSGTCVDPTDLTKPIPCKTVGQCDQTAKMTCSTSSGCRVFNPNFDDEPPRDAWAKFPYVVKDGQVVHDGVADCAAGCVQPFACSNQCAAPLRSWTTPDASQHQYFTQQRCEENCGAPPPEHLGYKCNVDGTVTPCTSKDDPAQCCTLGSRDACAKDCCEAKSGGQMCNGRCCLKEECQTCQNGACVSACPDAGCFECADGGRCVPTALSADKPCRKGWACACDAAGDHCAPRQLPQMSYQDQCGHKQGYWTWRCFAAGYETKDGTPCVDPDTKQTNCACCMYVPNTVVDSPDDWLAYVASIEGQQPQASTSRLCLSSARGIRRRA